MSKTTKSNHIEKLVFGGNGLTRIDGKVTFVPFSAPGDEVTLNVTKEKKDYQLAQIDEILKEGPHRVLPKCPHYKTCAGCQLQHLSYEGQLEIKKQFIFEALKIESLTMNPSPKEWAYRSHIRLNLAKESHGFKMGYIGWDNKSLVTPSTCPLFIDDPSFFPTLSEALLALPNEGIKSASLRIFHLDQQIYLAFSTFPRLPKTLLSFPFAKATAYKSPGKERKLGPFPFSPYGFMQSNKEVTEKIYQTIIDGAGTQPKNILDLYCGAGTTSKRLASMGHQVIGIEANGVLIPKKSPLFICSKVETALPKVLKTFSPDLIIVNPPRTGLAKEIIAYLKGKHLFYLSCMPSTLARDLERLSPFYAIDSVEAFDMFPQTTHVETLVKLTRIRD